MGVRKFMAKTFFFYVGSLFIYYHLKYLSGSWEVYRRPLLYWNKEKVFPGDERYPENDNKEKWEWFDNGFSKRPAHLDLHDPNRFRY